MRLPNASIGCERDYGTFGPVIDGFIRASTNNGYSGDPQSDHTNLNTKQLLRQFHGHDTLPLDLPLPTFGSGTPPLVPNVYTDGSLVFPTHRYLSLGGLGIWHAQRSLDDHPITGLEDAHHHQTSLYVSTLESTLQGLGISSAGYFPGASSTRYEIGAAVIALLAPHPIHIGSDSQSFINIATRILQDPSKTPKRPWGLCQDGDLWHLFQCVAAARPHASVILKKVKAHAKEAQVDDVAISTEDRVGNHAADTLAADGWRHENQHALQFHGYLYDRHRDYVFLMGLVTRMATHIISEATRRLDELDRINAQLRPAYAVLALPSFLSTGRRLMLHEFSFLPAKAVKNQANTYMHVYAFMSSLEIGPRDPVLDNNITWLEIYLVFLMRGGSHALFSPG